METAELASLVHISLLEILGEKRDEEQFEIRVPALIYQPDPTNKDGADLLAFIALINRTVRAQVVAVAGLDVANGADWTPQDPKPSPSGGPVIPMQPPYVIRVEPDDVRIAMVSFDAPYRLTKTLSMTGKHKARLRVHLLRGGETCISAEIRTPQLVEAELALR